jgi:hypothetical protein
LTIECLEDRLLLTGGAAGLERLNPSPAAELPILQAELRSLVPTRPGYAATNPQGPAGVSASCYRASLAQDSGAAYAATDSTPGDSTPGDSTSGDDYPIPPGAGPAQGNEVGLRPSTLALLLPLRDASAAAMPGSEPGAPPAGFNFGPLPEGLSERLIREVATPAGPLPRSHRTGAEDDRAHQLALGAFLDLSTVWDPRGELGDAGGLFADDSPQGPFAPPAAGDLRVALESNDTLRLPPAAQATPDDLPVTVQLTPGPVGENPPGDPAPASSPEPAAGVAANWTRDLLRRVIRVALVFNLGLAWKLGRDAQAPRRRPGRR